ncbi:MAG: RNA methyltransferase [Candidatus Nanohaloarchaea archaeon]
MRAAVLVRPEVPENTGFIARLCENFDFSLRLVEPGFNLEAARKTAAGAQEALRDAKIYDSVEAAVEDLDCVVGTKPGKGIEARELEPRENTSLMLGPESTGLSNRELELCDAVSQISTSGYSSLNQGHAAAIYMHRLHPAGEKGIEPSQKQRLEEVLEGSVMKKLLLRANPSSREAGRLLGEIAKMGGDSPGTS